jgi:hypothetical protein
MLGEYDTIGNDVTLFESSHLTFLTDLPWQYILGISSIQNVFIEFKLLDDDKPQILKSPFSLPNAIIQSTNSLLLLLNPLAIFPNVISIEVTDISLKGEKVWICCNVSPVSDWINCHILHVLSLLAVTIYWLLFVQLYLLLK